MPDQISNTFQQLINTITDKNVTLSQQAFLYACQTINSIPELCYVLCYDVSRLCGFRGQISMQVIDKALECLEAIFKQMINNSNFREQKKQQLHNIFIEFREYYIKELTSQNLLMP